MKAFSSLFLGLALLDGELLRAAEPSRYTLELDLPAGRVQGTPLAWDPTEVQRLGRDGRLWTFPPQEARGFRKVSPSFQGFSQAQFRQALIGEFGNGYEVSGTGHYLVVHPTGQGDAWSPRFEELYRSFLRYFSVRGFRLREPEFPLVAIAFASQDDFHRYALREGSRLPGGVLGYYSPVSNRVCLFDSSAGQKAPQDWYLNAETIIHEATHQTAFNTGVHGRFATTPRWVIEGLGTLFEAEGVWNGRAESTLAARIAPDRLAGFRQALASRPTGACVEFFSGDRMFQVDVLTAYSEAWAWSFFLSETRPRQYAAYLQLLANRPAFAAYPAEKRLADVQASLGRDLRMLESYFLRFMEELPSQRPR